MDHRLEQVDPLRLQKNPWNSNIVSPENETKLDESMRRLTIFKPILVRDLGGGRLQILGGEHRRDSAVRIGLTLVPVYNLGIVDDQRAKEISLADNSRYGTDDILQLSALIESLDDKDQLKEFLPFTETDLTAIFAASDIAVDDLVLDEKDETSSEPAPERERPTKTHTIMRFKVPLGDAERISAILAEVQKTHGFHLADDLTNAGDALVHALLGSAT